MHTVSDEKPDPGCRTHDVPNLFIGDGSVFVTGAAVKPAPQFRRWLSAQGME
jgi:choline dehydrogenase-like flavoprotein